MDFQRECRCDDGTRTCDTMDRFAGKCALPRPRASYTPFLLGGGPERPCFAVLPGGCYGFKAAHEGRPIAEWLNGLGISAVVLDYGTPPLGPADPLEDLKCLIRLMRCRSKDWGVDPGRVGVIGFSAGGHAAATLAVGFDGGNPIAEEPLLRHSCRPDAVVLGYPVLDLERYGHPQSVRNLFRGAATDELLREYTVRNRIATRMPPVFMMPPVFIWHTIEDPLVCAAGSIDLAAALASRGVPVEIHTYLKGAHGLGLATGSPSVRRWTEACASWLAAIGFREDSAV